jgi:DNA-binding transcriptional regulator of glucitol operon
MALTTPTLLIGGLVLMWLLQLGLSYLQMKGFYGRVAQLRRAGRTAIGLEGGVYRGRQYGILTVDSRDVIRHAEQLSGFTVLARPKPVRALVGQPMSILFEEDGAGRLGIPPKQFAAFRHAAGFIRDAAARQKEKKGSAADQETAVESASA